MTTTPRQRLSRIWNGIVFRPVSSAWVVAFLLGIGVAQHRFNFISGMLIWMALGLGLIVAATHRETVMVRKETLRMRAEVGIVHSLVNSQHDEMVDRIRQLVETLQDAGVAVPATEGEVSAVPRVRSWRDRGEKR